MEGKTEVKEISAEVRKEAFKQMVVDFLEDLVDKYDETKLDVFEAFNVKSKEDKIEEAIQRSTFENRMTIKALVQCISLENPEDLNELIATVFILASFIKTLQIESATNEARGDNS